MAKDRNQHIIIVDIDANTKEFLETKITEGYKIFSVTSLTPVFNKLLVIYFDPPIPEP